MTYAQRGHQLVVVGMSGKMITLSYLHPFRLTDAVHFPAIQSIFVSPLGDALPQSVVYFRLNPLMVYNFVPSNNIWLANGYPKVSWYQKIIR